MYSALDIKPSSALDAILCTLLDMMSTLQDRVVWCVANSHPQPSVIQIAKAVGVERHTVYLWTNGTTKNLTSAVSRKLADFFRVDRNWMETGVGTPRGIAVDQTLGFDEKTLVVAHWYQGLEAAEQERFHALVNLARIGLDGSGNDGKRGEKPLRLSVERGRGYGPIAPPEQSPPDLQDERDRSSLDASGRSSNTRRSSRTRRPSK